jgi:hypothetical protein
MPGDLATRVRLCCANELAAVGAYLRAESLLVQPPGMRISPLELDLLARIYVQQERFSEARVCWEKAASAVPTNPEFPKALAALREHQERLRLRDRITTGLYAFMAFIGLAAVLLVLLVRNPA